MYNFVRVFILLPEGGDLEKLDPGPRTLALKVMVYPSLALLLTFSPLTVMDLL